MQYNLGKREVQTQFRTLLDKTKFCKKNQAYRRLLKRLIFHNYNSKLLLTIDEKEIVQQISYRDLSCFQLKTIWHLLCIRMNFYEISENLVFEKCFQSLKVYFRIYLINRPETYWTALSQKHIQSFRLLTYSAKWSNAKNTISKNCTFKSVSRTITKNDFTRKKKITLPEDLLKQY